MARPTGWMNFVLPFWLVSGALVAAVAVLGIAGRAPDRGPVPALALRDPGGHRFELGTLRGRVWVASLVSARCIEECAATMDRLARLHDGLPADVPLVTLVVDGRGLWPTRPAAADSRPDWVFVQGNDTDADPEVEVRRMAAGFLGLDGTAVGGLAREAPGAWIVTVDGRGRPRSARGLEDASSAARDPEVEAAWGEIEFLRVLHRHPLRDAVLFTLVGLLLVGGVACARAGLVRVHPWFTACAGLITVALVGSAFHYVDAAGSVPSRGSGWMRPLYITVMGTHGGMSAILVVLALTLAYHASRGQLVRHRAIARWVAPAWIGVAGTGAVIYFLLRLWFGAR